MMPAHRSGAACSSGRVIGKAVGEPLVDDGPLGVAAVVVPAGEGGVDGKGSRRPAGRTDRRRRWRPATPPPPGRRRRSARRPDPGRRHGRRPRDRARLGPVDRQVALGHVEIGPAHPAGSHRDPHLSRAGLGIGRSTSSSGPSSMGPGVETSQARTRPVPRARPTRLGRRTSGRLRPRLLARRTARRKSSRDRAATCPCPAATRRRRWPTPGASRPGPGADRTATVGDLGVPLAEGDRATLMAATASATRVVGVVDDDAVVRRKARPSGAPSLAVTVDVPVEDQASSTGAAKPALDQSPAVEPPALDVEHGEVVVELHPDHRHPRRRGVDEGVGQQPDGRIEGPTLGSDRSSVMPCTAVAPSGIGRPGSTSPASRRTTCPPSIVTRANDTGTSLKRSTPVVSRSKPSSSPRCQRVS